MSEGVRWYAGTITHCDAWGYAKWPGRITTTDQRRAGVSTGNRIHLSSQGDARRWGLAIPRRHGRHVSDAVVESLVTSVDERWEKGPWCVGLAVEETGVGRVHVAISLSIVHLGG